MAPSWITLGAMACRSTIDTSSNARAPWGATAPPGEPRARPAGRAAGATRSQSNSSSY